ncbi:MAG: o-succinylbenzoate synthase [Candidatus Aminicenantes bacterium]|nr:o-succinylbenzoate synthase [Candidatus Aminicenantes bacterium]
MKIERVELALLYLPYVHFFETSLGREEGREFIIVKAYSEGLYGYGEVVASEAPFYSYETTSTAWHVLSKFLIPLVLQQGISRPEDYAWEARRFRGHPMAKAGLELALWDLQAKKAGVPLARMYGGTREAIDVGVSLGIEDSIPELLERVEYFIGEGYRRIKLKIKPGWDVEVVKRVREDHPEMLLQADANGAYSLKDKGGLMMLDAFDLLLLEQPFPPYDLWDHSRLQKEMSTPICLDESIIGEDTARQALEIGSCRVINIKVGRVGGFVEARKVHDVCRRAGIPVWCGGMLESGIGRAHNLHIASLPNFKLPSDLSASKRYYREDLIDPPIELERDGTIKVPEEPGIGVHPVEARIKRATLREESFS